MTHSAAMAAEILPGLTVMEALNTDLVCDAINTAMRELSACRINHSNRCQLFSAELRINFIWSRYKVLYIGCKYPYN